MTNSSVVRRMVRPAAGAAAPVAPTTILARAMRRACDKSGGVDVHVADAGERELGFDEALALIEADDLLIELTRGGNLAGCVVLSAELRAAIVEAQTLGQVNPRKAEPRPSSGADAALCMATLMQFSDEARAEAGGTTIDGWLDEIDLGQRLNSPRILELTLTDETLGVLELVCKIVGTKREGRLFFLLPLPDSTPPSENELDEDWLRLWRPVAQSVPAKLEAVLHRMVLGLSQVENFEVGDVLPLTGAQVTDLRLLDGTGAVVSKGRLGQMKGFRAMRVEPPPAQEMSDLSGAPVDAMPEMPMDAPALGEPELEAMPDLDMGAGGFDLDAAPDFAADNPSDADAPDLGALPEAEAAEMAFPEIDLPLEGQSSSDSVSEFSLDMPPMEMPDLDFEAAPDAAPLDLDLPDPPALDLDEIPAMEFSAPPPLDLDGEILLPGSEDDD